MRLGDLDALKEAIKAQRVIDREINPNIATISYHNLNNIIDNAPTVDCVVNTIEVRPQGKWKITRLQNNFDDVYCPFCNARPTRSEYGYYLLDRFCHDCGARLEGYSVGDEK